jgi:hypothetical protein
MIRVPAGVLDLARFALACGRRSRLLPADYPLDAFLVDAVWERSVIITQEKALGFRIDRYHLDRNPGFLPGEAGRLHLHILVP